MTINVRNPGNLPNVLARIEEARGLLQKQDLDEDVRRLCGHLIALAQTQHELNKRLWECLRGLPFGVMDAIEEAGGFPEDGELLGTRRPSAHTHGVQDITGLPADPGVIIAAETFAQRPHVHRSDEIQGLLGDAHVILASQVFGA